MTAPDYFDSSIVVAYYTPERLSSKAEAALRRARHRVVSELTLVEVAAAIARKVREKDLPEMDASRVYQCFLEGISAGHFRVLPMERKHFEAAARYVFEMGRKIPVRSLDALHIAAALLDCRCLVTADERQAEAARALGVTTKLVS